MGESKPKFESMWSRHCLSSECQEEPIEGEQTGTIPDWVSGVLYRTGYGVQDPDHGPVFHAFDNFAVVHGVEIKNGKARYRNKVAECDNYKLSNQLKRRAVTQFGTLAAPDPCQSMLSRFMSRFTPMDPDADDQDNDNPGVNVFFHGDELYGTTEANTIRRLDPETLDTFPNGTRHSDAVMVNRASAHPHEEPDGTVLNMGSSLVGGQTFNNIIEFPPPTTKDGKYLSAHDQASILAKIPARSNLYPSYYHSFGLTKRYIIFLEQPFCLSVPKLMTAKLMARPFGDCFVYDPKGITDIHVVDRKTGEAHKVLYKAPAFACYHHINAYEEEGHVVVDMCLADGNIYAGMYLDVMEKGKSTAPLSQPSRIILPLEVPEDAGKNDNLVKLGNTDCKAYKVKANEVKVTVEKISDKVGEMPRINYKFNGLKYRYSYMVGVVEKTMYFDCLIKNDAETKKSVGVIREDHTCFCEPIFIARPGATEEDDGVVLSFLYKDFQPKYTALIVIDAKSFKEIARVTFESKGTVPFTLHGCFKEKMSFK